jgi:SNF2 family DNA or RNA helicase
MGGYGGYQIVGYKNLDELQTKLNDIMLRRLKDEVLDLPEKIYVDEYVEMGTKQSKIYAEVTADVRNNIDKIKMSNNPLSEMIRMRQATGYPGILSSEITDSAKLDRMEELVDDAISNNKKVIIFSNWTQITDEVYKRLSSRYHCLQITGQTKDEERQIIVNKFQEDNNCKIVIGTTGAMGTGITIHAASVEIFMDEPWSKALKDQAEDRAHRIGQTKNLTIYSLLTKNTIDEKIHAIVYKKGLLSDRIVDQVVMDKGQLVDYLLS